jgi:hypothetical protein
VPVETKPKTREDLHFLEIDNEALLFDPADKSIHHLNLITKLIFELCDGKGTISETACGISEAFNAPLEDVERDVRRVVRDFRTNNLLEVKRSTGMGRGRARPRRTEEPSRDLIYHDVQPSG